MKERFFHWSSAVTTFIGTPLAFGLTIGVVSAWLAFNALTHSQRGADYLNLSISIASLLLLILLQMSQNRSEHAAQLQRSEIIRALEGGRDEFIGAEKKNDAELDELSEKLDEALDN